MTPAPPVPDLDDVRERLNQKIDQLEAALTAETQAKLAESVRADGWMQSCQQGAETHAVLKSQMEFALAAETQARHEAETSLDKRRREVIRFNAALETTLAEVDAERAARQQAEQLLAETKASVAEIEQFKPDAHRHMTLFASYGMLASLFHDIGECHSILSRRGKVLGNRLPERVVLLCERAEQYESKTGQAIAQLQTTLNRELAAIKDAQKAEDRLLVEVEARQQAERDLRLADNTIITQGRQLAQAEREQDERDRSLRQLREQLTAAEQARDEANRQLEVANNTIDALIPKLDESEQSRETLRTALHDLRVDANRLCDRQLGGTYEADCRLSIARADAALAASSGPPPATA